ncbi:MAG: glycerol kinase GlpK [Eubacteriales bacterium]
MEKKYILALDQGTTSSRSILFDKKGNIIEVAQKEFSQIYPKSGWVEHDPMEILTTQLDTAKDVVKKAGISPEEIGGVGITNQRETTVVWDKETGEPIYNAIVWQCRRTASICDELKSRGLETYVKENTGLVIDAYFSGTKINWILDNVDGAREKAEIGNLLFGTIDTWLIWNLTDRKVHVTDYSNASRTMIFNIKSLNWDKKLLEELKIPEIILPKVKNSSEIYGNTGSKLFRNASIPISGIAGDQQAALFGQCCYTKGTVKNTYGTGCFMLMNTGSELIHSTKGLLSTIAWGIDDKITYALEGSIFIAGAAVQWLRDEMRLIDKSEDSEYFAQKIDDNEGVYFVPAFSGLGAPHWDMYARGTIVGLTRSTNKNHIIRAALESIAYQTKDVVDTMTEESGIDLKILKVDGGATNNRFLMQFQADILNKEIERPQVYETTALGAAYLAGLAVGFWESFDEIVRINTINSKYNPSMSEKKSKNYYQNWKRALEKSKAWVEDK